MFSYCHVLLLWAVMLCGLPLSALAADLYGVGPFTVAGAGGTNLYTIDPGTGAATLVGATGIEFIGGIEFDPVSATLYAYTSDTFGGKLYTLDIATGAASEVGTLSTGSTEGGLAFSPGGVLYGIHAGGPQLLTIDAATGASSIVATLTPSAVDISGVAFSPAGALYGVDMRYGFDFGFFPDELHSIDTTTGVTTFIGFTSTDAPDNVGALDFNPDTGVLYLSDGSSLYTVDTSSGAATLIGAHGVSSMAGIVFVPEPAGAAVLLLALAGWGGSRTRKRCQDR